MTNEIDKLEQIDLFDKKWMIAENHHICDGFGGAEYRRVKREWFEAGKPKNISEFIAVRANAL